MSQSHKISIEILNKELRENQILTLNERVRIDVKKIQIWVDVLRQNIQPKTDSVYMDNLEIESI